MTTSGQRSLLQSMEAAGLTVDRKSYIARNWAGLDLSEWSDDDESLLPKELQDWSLFHYDRQRDRLTYIGPPMGTEIEDADDSDDDDDAIDE